MKSIQFLLTLLVLCLFSFSCVSCQQEQEQLPAVNVTTGGGVAANNSNNSNNETQNNDIKLPLNCTVSITGVYPSELLLQSFLEGDTKNFTSLWVNIMISSYRHGALLSQYGINTYTNNQELVQFLQELNTNQTQIQYKLENLLSTLELEHLQEVHTLTHGDDCSLKALSVEDLRGPCDFIFLFIHRMSTAKTMNLMVLAHDEIDQQVKDIAYDELANSTKNIQKLLQIAQTSDCFE